MCVLSRRFEITLFTLLRSPRSSTYNFLIEKSKWHVRWSCKMYLSQMFYFIIYIILFHCSLIIEINFPRVFPRDEKESSESCVHDQRTWTKISIQEAFSSIKLLFYKNCKLIGYIFLGSRSWSKFWSWTQDLRLLPWCFFRVIIRIWYILFNFHILYLPYKL